MSGPHRVTFKSGNSDSNAVHVNNDYASGNVQQSWNRSRGNRSNLLGEAREGDPLLSHNGKKGSNNKRAAVIGGGKNGSAEMKSTTSLWDVLISYWCGSNGDERGDNQMQTRGFGSVLLSMILLTFFATTLIAAIEHASEDDTNLMMKAAKQLGAMKIRSQSYTEQSRGKEIVNSHSQSQPHSKNSVNNNQIGKEIEMKANKQENLDKEIKQTTICNIDAPGEWNSKMNQRCSHELTMISVPSMGKRHGYRWPEGFSWTILKDDDEVDSSSSSSSSISKQFLASMSGSTVDHQLDQANNCDEYVTQLCLEGTYVIYANNDEVDDMGKFGGELIVCDKSVKGGEALDFSIKDNFCFMDSYEDGKAIKKREGESMKVENGRTIHTIDYSSSMSYSLVGSLSNMPLPSLRPSPRTGDKGDRDEGSDRTGDHDQKNDDYNEAENREDSQPTVPPTGSWVSPDTGETLNPLMNNSLVHAIKNFTDTYFTPSPSAAPTPSVSTAFFNNSDNCYSIPGFPKIYCYYDYQTSFPTPLPTEHVSRPPTNCMFFGLFGDCSDTDTPTSMPTTHEMNPEINQQMEDDVVAQQDEDTHDATKIEEKEDEESRKHVVEAGHEVQTEGHRQKRSAEKTVHKTEIVIAKERQHNEDEIQKEEDKYKQTFVGSDGNENENSATDVDNTSISSVEPPLTARQRANEVERKRDEKVARDVKKTVSNAYDSVVSETKQDDENESEGYMMSLKGADKNTPYNICMSRYEHPLSYLDVKVAPGCIALFTNDVTKQMYSYVTTYCGCQKIGPRMYDINALIRSRLVDKNDKQSAVSFIATGERASIAIYNSPKFSSEENSSEYKDVFGPGRRISLASLNMGDSGRTWDDQVYSIILDAWSSCDAPSVPCNDVTTQSPVTSPTQVPGRGDNSLVVDMENSNAAVDRTAEIEGEKDASFIRFVSKLEDIEESFLYSHDEGDKSIQSNVQTSSSPITIGSGNSIHPMALQVEGKEAREDEVTSAYFEDEIDSFDVVNVKKKMKEKKQQDESKKYEGKNDHRSHSHSSNRHSYLRHQR